jgi:hypothetical protein
MTYKTFNKDTDTLEVGTKIRLGGREGEIARDNGDERYRWGIAFDGDPIICNLDLQHFTFEIAVSPLTIDKRVKGEILCMMSDQGTALDKFITIEDYLNSLEET